MSIEDQFYRILDDHRGQRIIDRAFIFDTIKAIGIRNADYTNTGTGDGVKRKINEQVKE